ncbi:hypothetical protein C8Q76DRAFT_730142 [Earliella scabrosa]|nr:hypothetical protein C8Q76DRAFT_730142 [Earliella scabrosa]
MSALLLRQTRLAQPLSVARCSVLRCRRYATAAVQPRHELEQQEPTPVAGPSRADASSAPRIQASHQAEESPTVFSRVETYIANSNASGIPPTLEDLESCKPVERPPIHSPKYVKEYNEQVSSLCRAFTKEQLRKFLVEALGTSRHCATNRKKAEYAESILEQLWKWPTLSEIEKAKRERTEVITKMLPMKASDLFLILGRDGTDLLRMSQDYDVHISLRQKPMALRVEGTRAAVRQLTEHVLETKQAFTEEVFELPIHAPIPPDMVQRISRLAQAYLENVPSSPGQIRVFAKDAHALAAAKRLASRAIHEIEENSHTPVLTHLPAGTAAHQSEPLVLYPHAYAFYPYISPRPLPIIMNTSGAFRLRRVGEWLKSGYQEDIDSTGGLASEKGHILTESEESIRLRDAMLHALPGAETSPIVVKASLGHMLLTRITQDQRATLVPPLTGDHPFGKIRKWIASNPVKMSFVPDLPLPLLNTAPEHQQVFHRLVYHSISSQPHTLDSRVPTYLRKVISFEATLAFPDVAKPANADSEQDLLEDADEEEPSPDEKAEPSVLEVSEARCSTGVQADLNLLMPDRPMDLQLTVESTSDLSPAQQPSELVEYCRQLRAFLSGSEEQSTQPTPPFFLEHDGEKYLLHSNVSVRQSIEHVKDSGLPSLRDSSEQKEGVTRALCESSLDLESNQKSMHCQVTCQDPSDDECWRRFLEDCDRLSLLTLKSTGAAPLLDSNNAFI